MNWGRAWKAALEWFFWSTLWVISGVVLMFFGASIIGLSFNVLDFANGTFFSGNIVGVIIILIGFVIATLGTVAAFFKVNAEVCGEEVSDYLPKK